MKMEQTDCSETSAYKIRTPGSHPKERIQHSEHGESWIPGTEMYEIVILLGLLCALIALSLRLKCRLGMFGNELFRNICRRPRKLHVKMVHNLYL